MNIIEAMEMAKIGKRIRKASWIKGASLVLSLGAVPYDRIKNGSFSGVPASLFHEAEGQTVILPFFNMLQPNSIRVVGYTLSPDEILSTDWEISQE